MTLLTNDLVRIAWTQIWQVTLLVVLVGVIARTVGRRRPHLTYLLWTLVLLKCLTPPLWSSPLGVFCWAQAKNTPATVSPVESTPKTLPNSSPGPSLLEISPPADRSRDAATDFSASPGGISSSAVAVPSRPLLDDVRRRVPTLLTLGWLLGASLVAALFLGKWFHCRRIVRRTTIACEPSLELLARRVADRLGLRRPVDVRMIRGPIGPAVFGWLRPVVLLPEAVVAGKTPDQIEPILAHEIVHLRRGDHYWGMVQVFVELLWWFHPLVWWASRESSRARERCCDEEVVAGLPCRPAAYARCLVDVLELKCRWQPSLAMPGVRSVEVTQERLEDIMTCSSRFHRRMPRWMWAALLVAAMLVLPGGAIVLGQAEKPSNNHDALQSPQSVPTTSPLPENDTVAGQTKVTGQVVDSSGKPVPGAQVAVMGRRNGPHLSITTANESSLVGFAKSDEAGRFAVRVPALSSTTYYSVFALAAADGFNIGGQQVPTDAERPDITISLTAGQTIRGQVVNAKDQPVSAVEVCINEIGIGGPAEWIQCQPDSAPAFWPKPARTDQDGRFEFRGIDPNRIAYAQILDDRFARTRLPLTMKWERRELVRINPTGDVVFCVSPSRIFEGEVVYADTDKPVIGARVEIGASKGPRFGNYSSVAGPTDEKGCFRVNAESGDIFHIVIVPPEGTPSLICQRQIELADGERPPKFRIALPRGVLLRGKVVEEGSGRPIAGAIVQYNEYATPQYAPERTIKNHTPQPPRVLTAEDGTFAIAAVPGIGLLLVLGPDGDYIQQPVSSRDIGISWGDPQRHYVSEFRPLDLKIDEQPAELDIALRRGVTIRGRIIRPDGSPTADVKIVSRHFYSFKYEGHFRRIAKDGQFELRGLDPDAAVPFYFFDPKNELGTTVEISGRSAEAGPLVVRLEPCGKAVGRFVNFLQGEPQVQQRALAILITSPDRINAWGGISRDAVWDREYMANLDFEHDWQKQLTDDDGRFTFPALIPGGTYQFSLVGKSSSGKTCIVKSGETLHLPDIVTSGE